MNNNKNVDKIKKSYENLHNRFIKAYFSYNLYKSLYFSICWDVVWLDAATINVNKINNYWWILWQNTYNIYKEFSIIQIYSIYEKSKDTDNIISLIKDIRENIELINDNLFETLNYKDDFNKITFNNLELINSKVNKKIKDDLRILRTELSHCFNIEKKNQNIFFITWNDIENIFNNTKEILNDIRNLLFSWYFCYDDFDKNIKIDYENLLKNLK